MSAADGKQARKVISRSAQAAWEPGPDRVGPLAVLAEQDKTRVPGLVPVRYGRMLASAFTFYRGAAAIMAADLAASPDSGLRVQLCGDAHLSNFGVFQAPDRRLVFDVNDFDETLPGPFEWDVKRLAASVAIGARDRGFSAAEGETAVLAAAGAYRGAMAQFAAMNELDVWYARLDVEELQARFGDRVTKADRRRVERNLAKARNKGSLRALEKLTETRDGEVRIASRPPLLVPIAELAEREGLDPAAIAALMQSLLVSYRETSTRGRGYWPSATATSTPPTRSSGSAASAPVPGSHCCSAATRTTRSSSRSRKRDRRCWSRSPAPAASASTATASSPASG